MNKFIKLYEDSILPLRSTEFSAGYDLFAHEATIIKPGGRKLISTGIGSELNTNCYLAIVPRSGLAIKKGITVLNAPGTIDADYKLEIGVELYNTSDEEFEVKIGDRIAQAILKEYFLMDNDNVIKKERESGFGSTGV